MLSVIIPTLNRADVLPRAMTSLLPDLQGISGDDFEVVVVDGYSHDRTEDVVNSLASTMPVRLVMQRPQGVYSALNRGLVESTRDYFLWVNSDDRLAPGALAAAMNAVKSRPKIDVVTGTASLCSYPNGRTLETYERFSRTRLCVKNICFGWPIPNARVYARGLVERVGYFDENFRVGGDREWMLRLARLNDIVECYTPEYRYAYYQHPTSLTFSGAQAGPLTRGEYVLAASRHCASMNSWHADRLRLQAWRALHIAKGATYEGEKCRLSIRDFGALALGVGIKAQVRVASLVARSALAKH